MPSDGAIYVDGEQKVNYISTREALRILDGFGNNSASVMIGKSDYILIYDVIRKLIIDGEAVAVTVRKTTIKNEDDNSGTGSLNAGLAAVETGIGKVREHGQARKYSSKIHNRSDHLDAVQGAKGAKEAGEAGESTMSATVKKTRKKLTDQAENLMGRLAEMLKEFCEDHPIGMIIAVAILIVVLVISGVLTSCSALGSGINSGTVATSFTAEDDDIRQVETDYVALETALQNNVDSIETDHPGYDEYNYSLSIGPSELVGNIEGYPKLLQALQEISPVPVSFELIDGDVKGFYHLEDKKIVIQDGMSEVQTIKTLLHEMAHQKLHDKDNVPEAKDISRNGKEVEAESVAYVVCQHYGINTSDYSFSYVAGWSEGKETPELKASLDKIRKTASEFIYQIDQKMEVLMADKDQVQESAKTSSSFAQELMDKITEGAKDLGFISVVPETQEKTANPELKVVVDKALKDLDKKRTLLKVKESVKSKLKANTEKAEQAPKKNRTSKEKEERA